MSKVQSRVFLWAVPRSVSTAFGRAMMNRSNIKVLFEPFSRAYYLGPGKVVSRYIAEPINVEDTFKNMMERCEQPYPDVAEVFVKDIALFVVSQPEYQNLLPNGYIHTFLIRHPMKSILSYYNASINTKLTGWDYFDPSTVGFKEIYQMFVLVTRTLGQAVIVVDADDLLAQPEYILKQYCSMVGIEFQQSMVEWKDDPQELPVVKECGQGWFEHVLASSRFNSSAIKLVDPLVIKTLPQDVQQAMEESMPYYDKMYALRIKPQTGSE